MKKIKDSADDLQKHTLNLFRGQYEALQYLYPDLDTAVVIRHLLRDHIAKHEAKVPTFEVKLPE